MIAFVVALFTIWWLTHGKLARVAMDRPNDRSLHHSPIPRTGGIGLHAGILCAWLLTRFFLPSGICAAVVVLFAISLLDDMRDFSILFRLAVHLLAAGAISVYLFLSDYDLSVTVLVLFAVAWMTNLYNFMDGSDGLAGGMALFGFGSYGLAALFAGNTGFALLNFSISAAAVAFLIFNFYPAKIFMGDAGSVPLGYLVGVFGVFGWMNGHWSWWFPVLVFSPFIVDASVTLARRLFRGERFWQAHRDHYYQRLVQLGWGHRKTALAEYALMAASGTAALATLRLPHITTAVIALFAATYILFIAMISRAWAKRRAADKSCD